MEEQMISKETEKGPITGGQHFLYKEYIKSEYLELTHLEQKENSPVLVQHRCSGRIAVKKYVLAECVGIYQKLRELNHPNIPKIYEIFQNEDDGIIIEEFISGETLESKLENGFLPEEKVIKYSVQILNALQEIHQRNIIHRDITPSNILISSDDVIKLIDFGISRNWKENQKKDTNILGTVGYASPEQFGFQQTDITTDFYALGVLINVMLTGKLPTEERTDSKRFEKIVKKCIQIDPAKRYQSATRIRYDLTGQDIMAFQEEKKENIYAFPGFRSNTRWKKIVGAMGYVLMILYAAGSLIQCMSNVTAFLLELVSLLLLGITFLVGSNFARWDRQILFFRKLPQEIRIIIRVVICILLFSCAFGLDDYIRYAVLKFPRTS